MKVLILGATGFIGLPAAQAFSRAGHIVYGVTRSQSNADSLAREEIIPIVADPTDSQGLKALDHIAGLVDVVIDTVPATSPEIPTRTFDYFIAHNEKRPVGAKLTYIYTGGSWVHARGLGGLDQWTSEQQPHTGHVKLTSWRWEIEEKVLSSTKVHGIVIRPSLLYGRSGSLWSMLVFGAAKEAAEAKTTFQVPMYDDTRFAQIHQDDLAELYLRVAERGPTLGGQAFIGANPASERLSDALDAIVRVSGAKGWTSRKPANNFEEAWASTTMVKPTLGSALTGWIPRKMSLVDGIDVYWQAYLASL